jgi:hypothetical protein
MIDLIWIGIAVFAGAIAAAIIVEVFRWGYNKENKK